MVFCYAKNQVDWRNVMTIRGSKPQQDPIYVVFSSCSAPPFVEVMSVDRPHLVSSCFELTYRPNEGCSYVELRSNGKVRRLLFECAEVDGAEQFFLTRNLATAEKVRVYGPPQSDPTLTFMTHV